MTKRLVNPDRIPNVGLPISGPEPRIASHADDLRVPCAITIDNSPGLGYITTAVASCIWSVPPAERTIHAQTTSMETSKLYSSKGVSLQGILGMWPVFELPWKF
jgi:hypothetical protein